MWNRYINYAFPGSWRAQNWKLNAVRSSKGFNLRINDLEYLETVALLCILKTKLLPLCGIKTMQLEYETLRIQK